MQKRGTILLRLVLELVLAVVLISLFLSVAKGLGTRDLFRKEALERDIGLEIQALQSVPDNAILFHSIDESTIVRLEKNEVVVEGGGNENTVVSGNVKPSIVKNSKTLNVYKNGNEISISATAPTLSQRDCADARLDRSTLRIEAVGDAQAVASAVGFQCSRGVCAADASEKTTTLAVVEGQDGIAAHYSSEHEDVACTLLNQILAGSPETDTWLVPDAQPQTIRAEVEPAYYASLGTAAQELS